MSPLVNLLSNSAKRAVLKDFKWVNPNIVEQYIPGIQQKIEQSIGTAIPADKLSRLSEYMARRIREGRSARLGNGQYPENRRLIKQSINRAVREADEEILGKYASEMEPLAQTYMAAHIKGTLANSAPANLRRSVKDNYLFEIDQAIDTPGILESVAKGYERKYGKPRFVSDYGSRYYDSPEGVIRLSDHNIPDNAQRSYYNDMYGDKYAEDVVIPEYLNRKADIDRIKNDFGEYLEPQQIQNLDLASNYMNRMNAPWRLGRLATKK
jgi:hypothetical protein